jgi:hypothetical protein
MDLTMGRSEDAAVQFAFQLLKKAEDLVLGSYDQYDHVFATFDELRARLADLTRQHNELMRVLLPLNFITLSFRIEASRHPPEVQTAFFTLAAGMNRTVNEVRGTLEGQFEQLAASERIACRLIGQISASIQEHRRQVAGTLAASRRQLRALGERRTSPGSTSRSTATSAPWSWPSNARTSRGRKLNMSGKPWRRCAPGWRGPDGAARRRGRASLSRGPDRFSGNKCKACLPN